MESAQAQVQEVVGVMRNNIDKVMMIMIMILMMIMMRILLFMVIMVLMSES